MQLVQTHVETLNLLMAVSLAAAVVGATCNQFQSALLAAAISGGFGLFAGHISPLGLLSVACFALWAIGSQRIQSSLIVRLMNVGGITFASILFYQHLIPGFDNWRWLNLAPLSTDSMPFSAYINLDKVLAGIVLLVLCGKNARFTGYRVDKFRNWLLASALTISAVILCSFALGYVRVDFKWRAFMPVWMLWNLLFTVIPEEALFRGFFLGELDRFWPFKRFHRDGPILLCGALFGALHWIGGIHYVLLATLAGIGYGYGIRTTNSLFGAIGIHFILNVVHLVAFSYPALR